MSNASHATTVNATVEEILPSLGLAYLAGDDNREWTVTKSTRGPGLAAILTGQKVRLTVERHAHFTLVSEYEALA